MKHLIPKTMTAVPVLALALAVGGCGSSGDDDDMAMMDPTPQEMCEDAGGEWNANMCTTAEMLADARADAQRAAINLAITTANAAVAGLTDDATDTAISAAKMAVADAKMEVMDAADVDDDEKTAFNRAIYVIEGNLNVKETSIMAAQDMAIAETGKALHAALGPPGVGAVTATNNALNNMTLTTSTGSDGAINNLMVTAVAGAGAIADGTTPPVATLAAGDSAGSLGDWTGTSYSVTSGTGDAKVTNDAVVYTNQGDAETDEFGDKHELTDGSLTVDSTEKYALVMAAAFTHSGTQTHMAAEREDAVYIRGTYDEAPGEYSCTGTCTSTNDGSGSPSTLAGTWTFTPDMGAMVSQPDEHYLYYGWWVSKDSDGMPTAASAFAGRVGTDAADDGLDMAVDLSTLTGSATYVGSAAGKFAMSNPLTGTGNGGHFTADAELKAEFSGPDAGVTGTIDNFRLNDGTEDAGWSVSLMNGGLGSAGAISAATGDDALSTVWSIDDNKAPASGTWSGQMYDEMPGVAPDGNGSTIPTTVTGTFYSEFSTIGRMVGAFGADKE